MDLSFDRTKADGYKSLSQIARVLTEDWSGRNLFCVSCKQNSLESAPDNTAVYDFVCKGCEETYQLKSRKRPLGNKVVDAAYAPMIASIKKNKAPNLLLMHYNAKEYCVEDLIVVPRYFLSVSCIEKRRPLAPTARRAGWVGCNILLSHLPVDGRISIIKEQRVIGRSDIRKRYERFKFLLEKRPELRGWTSDVLKVVRALNKDNFTLEEVYAQEPSLKKLHPTNKHIRAKIRQQLQLLRDKGLVEFVKPGSYKII